MRSNERATLSSTDGAVLRFLMERARSTWAELAEHLGVTAPAAADRVRRLEQRGVIKGYATIVDPEAVGYPLTAFVAVSLDRPRHRKAFLDRVAALPQVVECHHVAGDEDYLLKVRCQGTKELEVFLTDRIKGLDGISRTRTTIVLSSLKESTAVPIAGTKMKRGT